MAAETHSEQMKEYVKGKLHELEETILDSILESDNFLEPSSMSGQVCVVLEKQDNWTVDEMKNYTAFKLLRATLRFKELCKSIHFHFGMKVLDDRIIVRARWTLFLIYMELRLALGSFTGEKNEPYNEGLIYRVENRPEDIPSRVLETLFQDDEIDENNWATHNREEMVRAEMINALIQADRV